MVVGGVTVGAIQVVDKRTGTGAFTDKDKELLEGLAAAAATAIRNAQLHGAERRARDLAVLLEISREITGTLDLDRVLQSVVNLAGKALPFDRGAVGLYEKGHCDIRAVAGQETVDPKDPRLLDLVARAEWAAGRGETLYLSDREDPGSDAERLFVTIFGQDLATDQVRSGLYLPLKDEEGVLGVLVFESSSTDFAGETQREVAAILANQTGVALRNAQLYHQVPMVDAIGALAARRQALLALPRRRLQLYAAAALLLLAAVTLIRWPLRVSGSDPLLRPNGYTPVRVMVDGTVERVAVREGSRVRRGDVLAVLRATSLAADRQGIAADAVTADRLASLAASRGDAAEERLHRIRGEALRRELAILDEELSLTTVRAPAPGTGADAADGGADGDIPRRRRSVAAPGPHRHPRARVRSTTAGHPQGSARPDRSAAGGRPPLPDVRGQSDVDRGNAHRARRHRGVSGTGCRGQSRRAPQAGHGGPRADTHRSRVHRHPDPAGARPLGPAHVVEDVVMRRNALGMVCLAAVACGGPAADGNDQRVAETSSGAMPASSLVTADTVTVDLPLSIPAQLYVEHDAAIYARSAGIVESILVDLGSRVTAGQLLGRLESADQSIALAQARDRHADAIVQAERQRALKTAGVVTQADSERVELDLRSATLALQKAQRDYDLTRIVAPFGGVVTGRSARIGRLVGDGDSLFHLTALSPVLASVRLPEGSAFAVKLGAEADVLGPSGERARARVIRASPVIDPASGTREVVLQLTGGDRLPPGSSVTLRIGSEARRVVAVPKEAIGEGYALVWDSDRTSLRQVTVGNELPGERVEVVSGLAPGEKIVRNGP